MKLLKKVLLFSVTAVLLSSCQREKLFGSGVTTLEERPVALFDQVVIEGPIVTNIQYGAVQHVSVRTDAVTQPRVRTFVQNNTLYLSLDESPNYQHISFEVNVEVPVVHRLTHSGISPVRLYGAQGPGSLEVVHDGVGELEMNGSTGQLILIHTGVGQVKANGLSADTCQIVQSGVGTIEVRVIDHIQGTLTGVGNVYYHGSPSVSMVDTGIGEVIHVN